MRILALLFCGVMMAVCSSCKKEAAPRTIVAPADTVKVSGDTIAMAKADAEQRFLWGDVSYEVSIVRSADKALEPISDGEGRKWFENSIRMTIVGETGTIFNRTFRKTDFTPYIDLSYVKPEHSTLTNIAFNGVVEGRASFIAAIGSPDEMDDEYMLVEMKVSKGGDVGMERVEDLE